MTSHPPATISLITGTHVERDAISNFVSWQQDVLLDEGYDVTTFTRHVDRSSPRACIVGDPWSLLREERFASSDLVIYHFGIQYDLFSALVLPHPRARQVVYFHNVTPPSLLDGPARSAALAGFDQLAAAAHADRVWSASAHSTATLLEHADVDPSRCRLLTPCGGIEPRLPERPPRGPEDPVTLLAVGRFVRAKGLLDLLGAIDLLPSEIRRQLKVQVAGSTAHADLRYLANVRQWAQEQGVEVLEDVSREHLDELYRSADIYVSPSHHEGFCVPVLEALSVGCRVITTDAGALPETVGGCGVIIATGDRTALADAISETVRAVKDGSGSVEPSGEQLTQHLDRHVDTTVRRSFLHEVRSVLALARHAGPTPIRQPDAPTRFAQRQARLLARVACPTCHGPLSVIGAAMTMGAIESGGLMCRSHGLMAVIDCFTPCFLPRKVAKARIEDQRLLTRLDLREGLTRLGVWLDVPTGVASSGADDAAVFDATGEVALIHLVTSADDGAGARIHVEGHTTIEVQVPPGADQLVRVDLRGAPGRRHRVHVLPSTDRSLTISGVDVELPPAEGGPPEVAAVNRGNPYPERFLQLVDEMAPDAMILDCGGGDRRFGDDRVFNMEYLDFELPDLYGDGLLLPFADDTFDLIMSQAVLEHVPDPQQVVDEMVRVLKPGGTIYIEIAFMQPLHAVPSHYMNVTPHGIAHLCRALDVVDSGTFGGLAVTFEWIAELVDAKSRLGEDRVRSVLATLAELDATLAPEELEQFASAVYLEGRKPVRGRRPGVDPSGTPSTVPV